MVPSTSTPEEKALQIQNLLRKSSLDVNFIKSSHQYFAHDQEFISVSSFLNTFVDPQDWDALSIDLAKKQKTTPEELRELWNIRKDFSIVRGTEFHLYVHKYLSENKKIRTVTPIFKEIQLFHKFWDKKNKDRYIIIDTELIVCCKKIRLAGTIDCLVLNKNTGKIYLLDWKTNRTIYQDGTGKFFLEPLSHLPNSDLHKYSLQLNMYRYLLEQSCQDLVIEDLFLIHFSPKICNTIRCLNLKDEIQKITHHRTFLPEKIDIVDSIV